MLQPFRLTLGPPLTRIALPVVSSPMMQNELARPLLVEVADALTTCMAAPVLPKPLPVKPTRRVNDSGNSREMVILTQVDPPAGQAAALLATIVVALTPLVKP